MASDKFDVCLSSIDIQLSIKTKGTKKFDNTPSGIKKFYEWLLSKCKKLDIPLHVLVEATGVYHEELAYTLSSKGINISIVLPNKSRKYLQALGLKSKNDKIDAYGLSLMCAQQKHEDFRPIDPFYYELRTVTRFFQTTQENITALKNQLHALERGIYTSTKIKSELKKIIATNERMRDRLEKEMNQIVNSRPDIKEKVERLCEVKGFAIKTVSVVIAETSGFENFKNIPGLVSFSGFDVVENSSGKHTGNTKISKKGNSRIRRALYFPSLTIVKHEPRFREFHDRIFERTKISLKAYTAVQKKMLVLMYTLWKNEEKYDPEFYLKCA